MLRRILCTVLLVISLPVAAISSGMEYAQMTNEQLIALSDELADVLIQRGLSAYISISGKKYHAKPTCSGMDATMRVPVNDLIACGYEPCKKCH